MSGKQHTCMLLTIGCVWWELCLLRAGHSCCKVGVPPPLPAPLLAAVTAHHVSLQILDGACEELAAVHLEGFKVGLETSRNRTRRPVKLKEQLARQQGTAGCAKAPSAIPLFHLTTA